MAKKSYLDSIEIPKPCDAPWEKMIGDDRKRFCLSCDKDVYNLSAMKKRDARKLVARNRGKICVRYARLPNGKIFTTDQKFHEITRKTSGIAAGVIATTLTLSAATYAQGEKSPVEMPKEKEVVEQTENDTSQISFTAYDSTGAVIPDALARLINVKTKKEFSAATDQNYLMQFSSIPIGEYKLEISASGFKMQSKTVQITQNIEPTTSVTLKVAGVEVVGDFVIIDYDIPFFQTIVQENIKSIKTSIASGFDVNLKDKDGVTALHVAVEIENLEIVKLLVQNKADVNAQDKKGRTPLMMIEESDNPIKIIKFLVQNGANINIQDRNGKTPLMYAVHHEIEELEVVKFYIKSGVNLETKDKEGNTALLVASDGFSGEIVEELLKAGANPHVKNKDGETPLSIAGKRKYITEHLRRYGAIK